MNVRELIATLSEFDLDAEVFTSARESRTLVGWAEYRVVTEYDAAIAIDCEEFVGQRVVLIG